MNTVMAGIGAKFLHLYGGPHDGGRWEVWGDPDLWTTQLVLPYPNDEAHEAMYMLRKDRRGVYYRFTARIPRGTAS